MAVAAFGYLQVGIVARSGEASLPVTGGHDCLAQVAEQVLEVELAVETVYFGQLGTQLVHVALRQTAHDVEPREATLLLGLGKLKYGIDAFFLGIADKAARVDNGYLALRIV